MTATFPGSVPTTSQLRGDIGDNVATFLSAGIGAGDTTINVDDTSDFPSAGLASLKKASGLGLVEVFSYTGKTGTSFTGVTRNFNGKGADAYSENDEVHLYWVADHHNRHVEESIAIAQYISDSLGLGGPSLLHQTQAVNDTEYRIETTATGKAAFLTLKNSAGTNHEIGIETDTDAGGGRYSGPAGALVIAAASTKPIYMQSGGTARLIVDGADRITFIPNGVSESMRLDESEGYMTVSMAVRVPNASAATPAYTFTTYPTTGFSARATNILTVSNAGVTTFEFQPGNLVCSTHMRIVDGTSESQGGLSFSSDAQQGLYRVGTNIWGLTNQGSLRMTFSLGSILVQSKFTIDEDGIFTAANPPFAFANDTDTGLANTAANNLDLVTTGVSRWRIDSSGRLVSANGQAIYAGNGSVSAPSVAFNNDPNNGMYYISTDRWGLAAGGALTIDISQSSVLPGADNGITLGNASFRWSDLRSVLINGADYGFENGWIMREFPCSAEDVQTKSGEWMRKNANRGIQVLNDVNEIVCVIGRDGTVYAKNFKPMSELKEAA